MLDERGESEAVESVQGIIAARLDALSAEEKSLIHDAAVIGKVFWLGAVGGKQEILHGLERKEFVQRARRSSIAGETEFAFSHLLVRDVAYGQIPRPERAKKHRQAAEWIETLGRPEDHAEMLAHHWRAALSLALAAGQAADEGLLSRARQALSNAGDRASSLNAPASAVAYYGEALDLWPADAQPPQLLFRFGKALHLAGDTRQIEALERAREALVAAGDRESAAEAESFLAVDAWLRGQRDDVFEHLARARDLVTGGPPSAAKARVLATSARYQALAAQHAAALEGTREALDLAETLGLEEVTVHALNTQGIARFWDGDPAGIDDVRRSLELALAQNLPEAQRAANNLATITAVEGDLREAKELYAEAQRLSERFGNRQMIRFQLGIQVWMRHVTGDWDAAMKIADEFVAESERTSTHYQETTVLSHRAAIRLARGDSDGALEDSRRAVELARQAKDPQALVPILGRAAVISVECGLADEARAAGEEALELVRESPGYADELSPLAPVAEALGLADEARALLEVARRTPYVEAALAGLDGDFRRAADAFVEIGATTLEADARLRAAEKLIGSGRRAEGAIELQKALAFYRSVGATACVRRGERLLAVSA
jgi:tetratricopeptide (TPR) repeat protein